MKTLASHQTQSFGDGLGKLPNPNEREEQLSIFPKLSHGQIYTQYRLDMSKIFTGERFAAVLGVEQSPLEAILLKRRIMGASWLSVSKPVRVDSKAQVRPCSIS